MRRAAGGALSGGGVGGKTPRDIFPNYFSGNLLLSAANTFTTSEERLPVEKFTVGRNLITVMEFLWLELEPAVSDLIALGDELQFMVKVGSAPTVMLTISTGSVLCRLNWDTSFVTSGLHVLMSPRVYLWAQAGQRGQPIATDTIHIAANSVGQAAAINYSWRIYYRFIQINALEFNGLLQSQLQ